MKRYKEASVQIWRRNKDGYEEVIWYQGPLKNKPKGWRVVK